MAMTILRVGPSAATDGVNAVVTHGSECLSAIVVGTEQQLLAAIGRELMVELGFDEVVCWTRRPELGEEHHGLRQSNEGTVLVVGTLHQVLDAGEGRLIYDLYIQAGPEFLCCDSRDLDESLSVGDCIELELRGLRVYPSWP